MSRWLGGSRTIAGGAGGPSFHHIVSRIITGKTPGEDSADNTKLADMAGGTVKGKPQGDPEGDPEDLSAAQILAILEADTPLASQADLDAEDAARVAADAALQSAVDDVVDDLATHDGLGVSAAHGPAANSDLATMAAARVKGRASGAGTGVPQDLTGAQLLAIIEATTNLATQDELDAVGSAVPTAYPPLLKRAAQSPMAIGSALTLLATITAASGKRLVDVGLSCLVTVNNTSATVHCALRVTYSDDSTETIEAKGSGARDHFLGGLHGIMSNSNGDDGSLVFGVSASAETKAIKKLEVLARSSVDSNRQGSCSLYAREVDA